MSYLNYIKQHLKAWTLANSPSGLFASNGNLSSTGDAYNRVPMIRRCVDLRANSLTTVPYRLTDKQTGDVLEWQFNTRLNDLILQISRDLDLHGMAVIFINQNSRRVLGFQMLHPSTIEIKYVGMAVDGKPILEYKQSVNGKTRTLNSSDVIVFKEFNPADQMSKGTPLVRVALDAAKLLHYQSQFAGSYYEKGAMPIARIKVPSTMKQEDRDKIQGTLSRLFSSVKNGVGRYLAIDEKLDIDFITPPMKDLAMPELSQFARREIAQAMGVPQTMLEDSSNRSSREQDTLTFWQTTIKPRALQIIHAFNDQLFSKMGSELQGRFEEMDVFQVDEERRSNSVLNLVHAGMPLDIALATLGYEVQLPKPSQQLPELDEGMTIQGEATPVRSALQDELASWRRYELKRIGKSSRSFECDEIPTTLEYGIKASLKDAQSIDEINAIFDDASHFDSHHHDENCNCASCEGY